MTAFVSHTTIDCRNAYELSEWWKPVLGYVDLDGDPNLPGHEECMIRDPESGHRLLFIEVPDAKAGKNRLHLDLRPRSAPRDEELETLLAHGATPVADRRGIHGPDRAGWSSPTRRATSSASCAPRLSWPRPPTDRVLVGRELLGLLFGFVVAAITTPVGVSGAVFLLPVQLSVLHVPSPRITPTNLLFNVVSGPGGLLRFRGRGQLDRPLAVLLLSGTVPGVVVGALLRVYVVADPDVFRLVAAAVLAPVGIAVLRPPSAVVRRPLRGRTVRLLALVVGVVGGLYGIGGGSVLGPLLVGSGLAVARVAPAALASTWVTSVVGVATYAVIALDAPGTVSPDWALGLATGLGGLAGSWVGASLQPRLPEVALRRLLGVVALGLAVLYVVQVLVVG